MAHNRLQVGKVYKHPTGVYVYITGGGFKLSDKTYIDFWTWRLIQRNGLLSGELSGPAFEGSPVPEAHVAMRLRIKGYTTTRSTAGIRPPEDEYNTVAAAIRRMDDDADTEEDGETEDGEDGEEVVGNTASREREQRRRRNRQGRT